jgi:DNA-binding MurR/RpiR family transcriptional regulator
MTESTAPIPATIRAVLPELRPSERRIAALVLNDPDRCLGLTAREFAELSDTSTASVMRFIKRLGYPHLNAFRTQLTRDTTRDALSSQVGEPIGDIDPDDPPEDIIEKISYQESQAISDTALLLDPRALTQAIQIVSDAKRSDAFGVGASALVGADLQEKLTRIGRTSFAWRDSHSAWTAAATLDADCAAIAITHSGTTQDTLRFAAIAKRSGAKVIILTNHPRDWPDLADVVLTTAAQETKFRSGAMASRIAQHLVLDCLFVGIAQRHYRTSMAALRDTYEAVHGEITW